MPATRSTRCAAAMQPAARRDQRRLEPCDSMRGAPARAGDTPSATPAADPAAEPAPYPDAIALRRPILLGLREAAACPDPRTPVLGRSHAVPAIAAVRTTDAATRPDPASQSLARYHAQGRRGAPDDLSHGIGARRCARRAKTACRMYRSRYRSSVVMSGIGSL